MSISKVEGRSGFPFNVSGKSRWSSFHFQGEGGPRDFLPISRVGKVLWISFEFQSELGGVRWMSFQCQGGGSSGFPFNFKVGGPLESCQFQRASKRNPLDFLSSSEGCPLELFSTFEGLQCPGFLFSFTGWVSEVPFNFKRFHFQRTGIRWIPFQIHGGVL